MNTPKLEKTTDWEKMYGPLLKTSINVLQEAGLEKCPHSSSPECEMCNGYDVDCKNNYF